MRILIKNGTIVNANGRERKDILTDGDRIIAIGSNLDAAGAEVIDAAGCYGHRHPGRPGRGHHLRAGLRNSGQGRDAQAGT